MRGQIDIVKPEGVVNGWCWDEESPNQKVEVNVLVDGADSGKALANLYREDLFRAKVGDGFHHFSLILPKGLLHKPTHTFTLVHTATQMQVGRPFIFHNKTVRSFSDRSFGTEVRKQPSIRTKGWGADGWVGIDSFIETSGIDNVTLSLFLPMTDNMKKEKKVAIFDGRTNVVLDVTRGEPQEVGPFSSADPIQLRIICEYAERASDHDLRRLGCVVSVLGIDHSDRSFFQELSASDLVFLQYPDAASAASSFDPLFYTRHFSSLDAPSDPFAHYLLLGRNLGYAPGVQMKADQSQQNVVEGPGVVPARHEDQVLAAEADSTANTDELMNIWKEYGATANIHRPSFDFDQEFYEKTYPDMALPGLKSADHFARHGRAEGRLGNRYNLYRDRIPDMKTQLIKLIRHERLIRLLRSGDPSALELCFELIALGEPVDRQISDFSASNYCQRYPDIKTSGMLPILHFLTSGHKEGRVTLKGIRDRLSVGKRPFSPSRATCLVVTHEFSRTGAPAVARAIAEQACETHNVAILSLGGGEMEADFLNVSVVACTSSEPFEEYKYFDHPAFSQVELAIVNSVESWKAIKLLVALDIPFAMYIHEYPNYILPRYKMKFVALYTDVIFFSSEALRTSWLPQLVDVGYNVERDSAILAQDRLPVSSLSSGEYHKAVDRLSRLIGVECRSRRIVYGAGRIQIRKGVDLFVMIAQLASLCDPETIFVWIGDGLNREDITYGVWLDKQIFEAKRSGLTGRLFFLPAGPHYETVCRAADILLMPSRIDPLPNVVFDAVRNGASVVLFENASGFDDDLYQGRTVLHRVPYGRIDQACSKIMSVTGKANLFANSTEEEPDMPLNAAVTQPECSMEAIFLPIADKLAQRPALYGYPTASIENYDLSILFSERPEQANYRRIERHKARRYGRRLIWKSANEAWTALRQEGGWVHANTAIVDYADLSSDEKVPPFSIHHHAFYVDTLANDIDECGIHQLADRVVFTTDTKAKAKAIAEIANSRHLAAEVINVDNQGRDILPFLRLVGEAQSAPDAVWLHLHQKKSLTSASGGDVWRKFLMNILAGSTNRISAAMIELASPGVGMVSAFDPFIIGWDDSRRLLPDIAANFPHPLPVHPVLFPIGSMFWVRASVVQWMVNVFGSDYPWPNEPIENDGSVFHLIERLWPAATAAVGLSSVFVDRQGIKRM